MSSCDCLVTAQECLDEWQYYPKQYSQSEVMTFKGCDPLAPDNNGQTWCYLKGGKSASTCAGANESSGVVGDQHYWALCETPDSDLRKIAELARDLDVSELCASFSGDTDTCEEKSMEIIKNCSDCMTNPKQKKCTLENQDISWNDKLVKNLQGEKQSCVVLGSYFTNAVEGRF